MPKIRCGFFGGSIISADQGADFQFHLSQTIEWQKDGSLIIRLSAGSAPKMAWHLYAWGDKADVQEPEGLADMVHGQCVAWPALP